MMLVECLKCGAVMCDDNPSIDSREYTDEEIEDIDIVNMIIFFDDNDDEKEYGYYVCPNCKTNGHLIDCKKNLKGKR